MDNKIRISFIQKRYSQYPTRTADIGLKNNRIFFTEKGTGSQYKADELDVVFYPVKKRIRSGSDTEKYILGAPVPGVSESDEKEFKAKLDLDYVKVEKIDDFSRNTLDKIWGCFLRLLNCILGGDEKST